MTGDAWTDGFRAGSWPGVHRAGDHADDAQVTNRSRFRTRTPGRPARAHDPLFPTNPRRQRRCLPTAKGGHFHDWLRRTVGVPRRSCSGTSALECAERLAHYHRPMSGVAPDGSAYRAVDPDAMLFAAVTIAHAGPAGV